MSLATERPLAGIRVIDQACGLCGRLLADLGAEVICVEPPGGAASRRMAPFHNDTSLYFTVRNLGKKSVTLDMDSADDRRRLDALLDNADVWIESNRALDLNRREVLDRHPQLIITSITPFGLTGPYRDYQVTDAVLVAMSGLLFRSGAPDRPPLLAPGALTADIAGTTAAFGTVMALYNRTRTGRGDHLDVSIMEAAAQTSDWAMPSFSATKAAGGQYFELRTGNAPIYSMYPCADGFVRLIILNRRQWRAMRAWLGEPEVVQADHFDFLLGRMQIQADILDPLYAEFFKDKTKVELALEAQRRGLAMTPVLTPDEVLAADHFAERKSFRGSRRRERSHRRRLLHPRRTPSRLHRPGAGHRCARSRCAYSRREARVGSNRCARRTSFRRFARPRLRHRRRRRRSGPPARGERRRRHQDRNARAPRLHPRHLRHRDEPGIRLVQPMQTQPRHQSPHRTRPRHHHATRRRHRYRHREQRHRHDGKIRVELRTAARNQPAHHSRVESDDGRERSVERLDRFRPQLPHRDRNDLPLELPRGRDAAGLRCHSSRSHGRQDAGSGSDRNALRAGAPRRRWSRRSGAGGNDHRPARRSDAQSVARTRLGRSAGQSQPADGAVGRLSMQRDRTMVRHHGARRRRMAPLPHGNRQSGMVARPQIRNGARPARSPRRTRSPRRRMDFLAHRPRGNRHPAARRCSSRLYDVRERYAGRPAPARARLPSAGDATASRRNEVRRARLP